MWKNCLVCSSDLGTNEEVEHFPIGRSLAYDPFRGRLWAICSNCGRWNLTPLDQRWEALEELERLWRGTSAKVTGEELGLARLPSGARVVRIGKDPSTEEIAVWRWSRRIVRRPIATSVGLGAAAAGALGVAWVFPPVATVAWGAAGLFSWSALLMRSTGGWGHFLRRDDAMSPEAVSRSELSHAGLAPSDEELGWAMRLERTWAHQRPGIAHPQHEVRREWILFEGDQAISIARKALPLLNRRVSSERTVTGALARIDAAGGPEAYLRVAAREEPRRVKLRHYPGDKRLALEMVLFQEQERKAMAGELRALELAWREAEELAEISDGMF